MNAKDVRALLQALILLAGRARAGALRDQSAPTSPQASGMVFQVFRLSLWIKQWSNRRGDIGSYVTCSRNRGSRRRDLLCLVSRNGPNVRLQSHLLAWRLEADYVSSQAFPLEVRSFPFRVANGIGVVEHLERGTYPPLPGQEWG